MKLSEKLMKLRKENVLSQEEFANKLNVSRQTVSKWELGQTIPDTDNLTKIASIFGISVNDLLDDNVDPIEEKSKTNISDNNSSNSRKKPVKILILVIILICVFLGIGVIAINKIKNQIQEPIVEVFQKHSISDIFDMIFGEMGESQDKIKEKQEEMLKEYNKDLFNNLFKGLYYGSTNGAFMYNFIDTVLKSNDENPNNLITVKYRDFESNKADEIRSLKKQIKNHVTEMYEIYYEYDENGYINKAIIEDAEK